MVYKCRGCGNTERFRAEQRVTQWGEETVELTGDGEITDWIDFEISDSESDGDFNNLRCVSCDSPHIYDEEEDEEDVPKLSLKKLLEE